MTDRRPRGGRRPLIPTLGGSLELPLASHVIDNLWIGGDPYPAVPQKFALVVDMAGFDYKVPRSATRYAFPILDDPEIEPPAEHIARAVNLIRHWRKVAVQRQALVHCQVGLNRSALVVALALVHDGMAPEAAIHLLRRKRDAYVLCNERFEAMVRAAKPYLRLSPLNLSDPRASPGH